MIAPILAALELEFLKTPSMATYFILLLAMGLGLITSFINVKMMDLKAREYMTKDLVTAAPDEPLSKIIGQLKAKDVEAVFTSNMETFEGLFLPDHLMADEIELLKDKAVCSKTIWLLRKVTGVRQIEIAELMVSANNYTKGYAEALVLAGRPKTSWPDLKIRNESRG